MRGGVSGNALSLPNQLVSGCSSGPRPPKSAHGAVVTWASGLPGSLNDRAPSTLSVPTNSLSYKDKTGLILLSERDFGIFYGLKFLPS